MITWQFCWELNEFEIVILNDDLIFISLNRESRACFKFPARIQSPSFSWYFITSLYFILFKIKDYLKFYFVLYHTPKMVNCAQQYWRSVPCFSSTKERPIQLLESQYIQWVLSLVSLAMTCLKNYNFYCYEQLWFHHGWFWCISSDTCCWHWSKNGFWNTKTGRQTIDFYM